MLKNHYKLIKERIYNKASFETEQKVNREGQTNFQTIIKRIIKSIRWQLYDPIGIEERRIWLNTNYVQIVTNGSASIIMMDAVLFVVIALMILIKSLIM